MYRAWANGIAPDRASARFLQKAGYIHEATLRAAVVELVYARMRE
jgi:RimJ/RimL family protein N-acetyltransferase